MLCRNVVITGCNRGLGLELVKQLTECPSPPKHIIATCRSPDSATSLKELQNHNSQTLKVLKLDLRDESQYENFRSEVEKIVGSHGLNLLINNAGVSPKSTQINVVTRVQMEETFLVNTISPLLLTKVMLPLLEMAASKCQGEVLNIQRAAVINVSSTLGSLTENKSGGLYPYRASKCALNMITKSLSIELRPRNILVTSLHPGWVQTDMGGKSAPLTPQQSIFNIIKMLYSLSEEHNGSFIQYDGEVIPW